MPADFSKPNVDSASFMAWVISDRISSIKGIYANFNMKFMIFIGTPMVSITVCVP